MIVSLRSILFDAYFLVDFLQFIDCIGLYVVHKTSQIYSIDHGINSSDFLGVAFVESYACCFNLLTQII